MHIYISGGPGAGCTSTAIRLGKELGLPVFDSDDFFHKPTSPPYQEQNSPEERKRLLSAALDSEESWILSGSIAIWGLDLEPIEFGIFLNIPKEERMKRLALRERERFGAGIDPGGNWHEEYEEFLSWAGQYEERTGQSRNLETDKNFLVQNCANFMEITEVVDLNEIVLRISRHIRSQLPLDQMSAIYDSIGDNYASTRRADTRIVDRIVELLDVSPDSRILDIGAGTGSYAHALADQGFEVTALEPSTVMSSQASSHPGVSWVTGSAENLPFDSSSFDGAILILCLHHFSDLQKALSEAERVTGRGPVLIFTYDPAAVESPWLFEYFPIFREQIKEAFPSTEQIAAHFKSPDGVTSFPFPLPHDLKDSFAGAAWRNPERYLEKEFRDGTSAFRQLDAETAEACLDHLRSDLASGAWDQKYSHLRLLTEYDHGYLFILA